MDDDGNYWITTVGAYPIIFTESSFRMRRLFKNVSRKYRVTFKFFCETVRVHGESNRATSDGVTTYSFVHYLIANKNFSTANLQSMKSAIETQLIIWSLPLFEHVPLIVVRAMMRVESKHNSLDNDFHVEIRCARILRRSQDLEYTSTLDGDVLDLTDESSTIGKLESKVMMLSNEECVICLEELPVGCEVVSMPCSHAFHGNCIQMWLRTSPCCPICRFEIQDKRSIVLNS